MVNIEQEQKILIGVRGNMNRKGKYCIGKGIGIGSILQEKEGIKNIVQEKEGMGIGNIVQEKEGIGIGNILQGKQGIRIEIGNIVQEKEGRKEGLGIGNIVQELVDIMLPSPKLHLEIFQRGNG